MHLSIPLRPHTLTPRTQPSIQTSKHIHTHENRYEEISPFAFPQTNKQRMSTHQAPDTAHIISPTQPSPRPNIPSKKDNQQYTSTSSYQPAERRPKAEVGFSGRLFRFVSILPHGFVARWVRNRRTFLPRSKAPTAQVLNGTWYSASIQIYVLNHALCSLVL